MIGRHVTFLELFYDLVYVVIIAELSHSLSLHVTLEAFGSFIFLFVLVWFIWLNAAVYHNLHGRDDVRTRTFAFLQMAIVVVMAVYAHDAVGETSDEFALAYASFLILMTFLWWRTGVHDPDHRPQTIPYITSYPVGVILFIVSVFVPTSIRFPLWGIALLVMIVIPGVISSIGQRREYFSGIDLTSASLRERFKLFTIIVFGEVILAVTIGLSQIQDINITNGLLGALGLILAFELWWMYFDASAEHPVKSGFDWFWAWAFVHLPIWIGITAVGPSVLNIIVLEGATVPYGVYWLMIGSIALALASVGALLRTLKVREELGGHYRNGFYMLVGLAGVTILMGFLGGLISPFILLLSLLVILLVPITYALYIRMLVPDLDEVGLG